MSNRSSANANAPIQVLSIWYPKLSDFKCLSSSSIIRLNSSGLVDAPCYTPFYISISPRFTLFIDRLVLLCSYMAMNSLTIFSRTFLCVISSRMSPSLTESNAFSRSIKISIS